MPAVHRTHAGHWADQKPNAHGIEVVEGEYVFSAPAETTEPARAPFWPVAVVVGFPFILALVVWLVLSILRGGA